MQMVKNHSLQLDLVCPFVSALCSSTVVEMKLMVLSGGHVEKVVRPSVWLGGGGVVVPLPEGGVSVPKQGHPGATVRICWMKVTVVTAVTHGYVNAEPEMVVTLPVGVGKGIIPPVRQASCRLGSSTTVCWPKVTVEAVLPVAQGKVCVVPLMAVPEGKHASCPVGESKKVSPPRVAVEVVVNVLQGKV